MPHAIRFHKVGGPEVLQWEEVKVGDPGPGEARIAHKAIGLNYIDTYHRTGLYPLPLPSGLGLEAAGVVEAVGAGVTDLKAGDRVAYCNGPVGAYSEAKIQTTMLNQCILTGNLGDDPSSHYTPEGLAITHFNIAFKSSAKKKDANWIKVSCFRKARGSGLNLSPQGRQDRCDRNPRSKQVAGG